MTRRGVVAGLVAGLLAGSAAWAAGLTLTAEKLTVDSPDVCSRNPDADAYVDQVLSTTNFGTGTSVDVRSLLLGNRRTHVHFDLSPCSIPASATVVSAYVKLYLSTAPSSSRTYDAYRITGSWTETGVTWGNQPSVAALASASASTGTTSGVTLEWNVTSDVAAFVAGSATNYGWRVGDLLESNALAITGTFSAREHATSGQRPILLVTYR
ncbi:MAG: DNRLRE domain-containing protein [Actinobacteria bacterium]|nr:DNRLRE domain-containing protein [Actinomycetota bacterium]